MVFSFYSFKGMFLCGKTGDCSVWERESCPKIKVPVPKLECMTLEEKIGQMTQVDQLALGNGDDVKKYFIGGGGGSPSFGNSPKDWADLVDHFQSKALKT